MSKKDEHEKDKDAKVLGTGAQGDPNHPEAGAPVDPTYFEDAPVVVETRGPVAPATPSKSEGDDK